MLATFRRNGKPVGATVWLVSRHGHLYVRSVETSGKVKRITQCPHVRVTPCTQGGRLTGTPAEAQARILTESEARAIAPAYLFRLVGKRELRSAPPRFRYAYGRDPRWHAASGRQTPYPHLNSYAPAFHRRYPILARLFETINRVQGHTRVYLELVEQSSSESGAV